MDAKTAPQGVTIARDFTPYSGSDGQCAAGGIIRLLNNAEEAIRCEHPHQRPSLLSAGK